MQQRRYNHNFLFERIFLLIDSFWYDGVDDSPTMIHLLQDKMEMDVEAYLRRRYESQIADIEIVDKEDLDLVSFFFPT